LATSFGGAAGRGFRGVAHVSSWLDAANVKCD